MFVVAAPAFSNRLSNPYNALLYAALATRGVHVTEYSRRSALRCRPDVLHVHWPEAPLNKVRRRAALARAVELLVILVIVRRRGTRVVWTVHNTQSHFRRYPWAERLWWALFVPLVDGWCALSAKGATLAVRAHPRLAALPHVVAPHGHYRDAYRDDLGRAGARSALALPADSPVAAFVGRIKPYKGVPDLLRVFATVPDARARLLVAGRCDEPSLHAEVVGLAAGDPRVVCRLTAVPDDELQVWLRAADVAVLPYRAVLNSGSALLALSFDVPVVVPADGTLSELADDLPGWVRTYHGELTTDLLGTALSTDRPAGRPPLRGWGEAAEASLQLYAAVLAHERRP